MQTDKPIDGVRIVNDVPIGRYKVPKGKRYERSLPKLFPDRQLTTRREIETAYQDFCKLARDGKLDPQATLALRQHTATLAEFLGVYRAEYMMKVRRGLHPMVEFNAKGQCIRGSADNCRLNILINSELGNESLVTLSQAPRAIAEFLETLETERDITGATLNRYRALLKSAFNYAIQTDEWGVTLNPFWKTKILPFAEEQARTRRVSTDEEDSLIANSGGTMRARIQAALGYGFRRGELLKAQLKMFNFKDWTLTLPRGIVKTNKSVRVVPIEDPTLRAFLEARRFLGPDSHPFGNDDGTYMPHFNGPWRTLLRNAFVVEDHTDLDLRFHDLRAEFVSRAAETGKPMQLIADIIGDTLDTVEKHYKRVLSVEALRKVLSA